MGVIDGEAKETVSTPFCAPPKWFEVVQLWRYIHRAKKKKKKKKMKRSANIVGTCFYLCVFLLQLRDMLRKIFAIFITISLYHFFSFHFFFVCVLNDVLCKKYNREIKTDFCLHSNSIKLINLCCESDSFKYNLYANKTHSFHTSMWVTLLPLHNWNIPTADTPILAEGIY